MNTEMISAKSAVKEYLRLSGHQGEIDKADILVWTNDAVSRIITDEQFIHEVVLLEVENYKAKLPSNFKTVTQAAYKISDKKCSEYLGEVIEFTDRQLGCNIDIEIKCPKCSKKKCSCNNNGIVINTDRLWRNAHPEYQVAYMKHFSNYSNADGGKYSIYHPEFRLMKYATGSFANNDYHIGECPNLNVDSEIEYTIEFPYIITNFKEGTILLSFLGKPVDEDGYLMIPNEPIVMEAIAWYIHEKMLYRFYMQDLSQMKMVAWQTALQLKEKYIARAKSELQIPDYDIWNRFIKSFVHKILPRYNYENELYKATSKSHNYRYPEQTYNYRTK